MLSRVCRNSRIMYLQLRMEQERLLTERHISNAPGDGGPDNMMNVHSGQTTTEEEPLLPRAETSSNSSPEDENLAERDLHFPGADTGPDSDTEEEQEPEASPTIVGVVLVVLSTAVFALAEHYFGLCTAAGVQTSHLLLFRSVCLFTLNLGGMAFSAVVKAYEPEQSQVQMKSRLPTLMLVGMATTLTTVIIPLSYLVDIPRESIQACILTLTPMYTTAMAYCFLREKFAKEKFFTIAVCFLGTFLFITGVKKPESDPETSLVKDLLAVILPPTVSTAFVSARALLKNNIHPTTLVFAVQLTSILFLLPFNLRFVYETLSYGNVSNYSMDAWMSGIAHSICHSTASYLLYFGLKYEKAGIVQVLMSGIIPFSLLLNYVMFGRVPFISQTVGGAFAAAGVALLVVMTCSENKLCTGGTSCNGNVHVT